MDKVNYLIHELTNQGAIFCISGPLSQNMIVEIGNALKYKMRLKEAGETTILRVFAIVIEQAQNILRYSAERIKMDNQVIEDNSGIGNMVIGYENEHYYVLCSNVVKNDDASILEEKLAKIRSMNKDELKNYYKEQRKKSFDSNPTSAGLGFIEIARKAYKPIEFSLDKKDEKTSIFSMKVII